MLRIEKVRITDAKKEKIKSILFNQRMTKSLVAYCMNLIFLIKNIEQISFEKLLEICEIEAFDYWKIIRNLMKYSYKLPSSIKRHLKNIKKKIITSLAWKKSSSVIDLIKKYFEKRDNKKNKVA